MDQVSLLAHESFDGFAFRGSYGRDRETQGIGSHTPFKCTHESKAQTQYADNVPAIVRPSNKIRSRNSEAASPN